MRKPCQTDAVVSNLLDIAATLTDHYPSTPVQADPVSELLLKLHFNPNYDGYEYCKRAIPLFAANPEQFVTKELYTSVGKPLGKNWKQVERSMRNAIEKAWELDDAGIWQSYFPSMIVKPANKIFISAAVRLLFPAESCKVG